MTKARMYRWEGPPYIWESPVLGGGGGGGNPPTPRLQTAAAQIIKSSIGLASSFVSQT
jgi:hypothetical protein